MDNWLAARTRPSVPRRLAWACAPALLLLLSTASAAPYVYVARAHFLEVNQAFVNQGTAPAPGAGIHAFQDPDIEDRGTECFEIRWYANPPGVPPGAVLLLECVHRQSPVVKNHVLRTSGKSEGHTRSVIEIPPDEVRKTGRVLKWRARIVWRGTVLDTRTSENWDG